MTNYEKIKSMSQEELANFLDNLGFDGEPWALWFEKEYCNKCESIIGKTGPDAAIPNHTYEACYCEMNHGKCKFFENQELAPDSCQMAKLWLNAKAEEASEKE